LGLNNWKSHKTFIQGTQENRMGLEFVFDKEIIKFIRKPGNQEYLFKVFSLSCLLGFLINYYFLSMIFLYSWLPNKNAS
jgi:hypothetical protein